MSSARFVAVGEALGRSPSGEGEGSATALPSARQPRCAQVPGGGGGDRSRHAGLTDAGADAVGPCATAPKPWRRWPGRRRLLPASTWPSCAWPALIDATTDVRRLLYRLRGGHVRRLRREAMFHADHQVTSEPIND
jgi:hypothetical protein